MAAIPAQKCPDGPACHPLLGQVACAAGDNGAQRIEVSSDASAERSWRSISLVDPGRDGMPHI